MKLHQLFETPIKDIDHVGDFDKRFSWKHKRDRMLVTHPATLARVKEKFGNVKQNINLLFVNTWEADDQTEIGSVNVGYIRDNLGDEVSDAIQNMDTDNSINIIFTNNKGDQRIPMTPWIMAHRMMHAFARYGGATKEQYVAVANNLTLFTFEYILPSYGFLYPNRYMTFNKLMFGSRNDQLMFKHFFHEIGTFRSAREKKLREWFEVINEVGAQYIITGKIKFNELPQCFGPKGKRKCLMDDEPMVGQAEDALNSMGDYAELSMDELLDAAVGKIFIM